ncbi:uncharacterized protein G2W53_004610 [Senna tora]|uniref:Uncharacterized protein n=1 Tax=Senna tora TaxID=362788 RepID=A0A835CKE4_9FABA|nr:uncharacterized protein G2W53_004610 [Senna tora]
MPDLARVCMPLVLPKGPARELDTAGKVEQLNITAIAKTLTTEDVPSKFQVKIKFRRQNPNTRHKLFSTEATTN